MSQGPAVAEIVIWAMLAPLAIAVVVIRYKQVRATEDRRRSKSLRPDTTKAIERPESSQLVQSKVVRAAMDRKDWRGAWDQIDKASALVSGVGGREIDKDELKRLVAEFHSRDPTYRLVIDALMPVIRHKAGIRHAELLKMLPEDSRWAGLYSLHVAHAHGELKLVKTAWTGSGISYQVFLSDQEFVQRDLEPKRRLGPSLDELNRALLDLLAYIGYPHKHRPLMAAELNDLWDDSRKAVRRINELIAGKTYQWPEYERRVVELQAVYRRRHDQNVAQGANFELTDAREQLTIGHAIHLRAEVVASNEHRHRQMLEVAKLRPWRRFHYVGGNQEVMECAGNDQRTARFDQEGIPRLPCWRPDCRCWIQTLSDRELATEAASASGSSPSPSTALDPAAG